MPQAVRAAKNERIFREVNERISELDFGIASDEPLSFVCECSTTGCVVTVSATLKDYRAVRANPRRFLVAPGHVNPKLERIVIEADEYAVVEKVGAAAEIAEEQPS